MQIKLAALAFLFSGFILSACPASASAEKPKAIVSEDYFVNASDPGIRIFVRNKHLKGMKDFTSDRIVLFVHGSTYPADTSFDLPLGGYSWMDYIAQRGFDVYLLDLRGYGRSTRPPEMDQPADKNPPIVTTDVAVRDVAAVVDSILTRRKVPKINLIGWSWGTKIMAGYTSQHNDKVEKLVLYAAGWLRTTPTLVGSGDGPLGAYRTVTMSEAKTRWLTGVPESKKADLIPVGWFEQWAAATQATDPQGSAQKPAVLRAPNGTVQDTREFWLKGKPLYDPALIKVPVLIINAEWDMDTPPSEGNAVFEKLTNAPYRRRIILSEGTHTIIMERNRLHLFREVQLFLEEPQVK
jgi:pimeloyl-ACP methyl ester carboxylesterase